MPTPYNTAKPLPAGLILVGSILIAFHLLAVIIIVLAASSGPWTAIPPFPITPQEPPQFAATINSVSGRYYLQPLYLASNYHFSSNRIDRTSVRFEVRLKDDQGNDIKTLVFPDESANFWVRTREILLAQNLAEDQDVQSSEQNKLPAPGQEVANVQIWERSKDEFQLKTVPVTSVPRDRPARGPSNWSQIVARSYLRFLTRRYGAASGELIRHSREPIPPVVLVMPAEQRPPDLFGEMVANFTER